MQGFVVYLIILAIGMVLSNVSKKKKQQNQQASRPAVRTQTTQAQKQPGKQALSRDEIKKAVEVLMAQQPATPAQPTVIKKTTAKPAQPVVKASQKAPVKEEDFYEGTSFGDEGVDPCHDDMFENRVILSNEQENVPVPAAVNLQFTPDSVLNGIIMSEVLNRRA